MMRFVQLLLTILLINGSFAFAEAQDIKKYPDVSQLRNKEISLLRNKIEWAVSDMTRMVEEIRRIDSIWSKRLLVEEVENILFREVEIPLYMYGDDFSKRVKKEELPKMTELYARAFAIAGIARIFEGFSAAADTYLERAKLIYPDVANLSVKIDSFEAPKPIQDWIEEGRKREIPPQAVRVSFHAKNSFPQNILDKLGSETVRFQSGKGQKYIMRVAAHDFLVGLFRRVSTDEVFTEKEDRQFYVYLPPGKYEIVITHPSEYKNQFQVHSDQANNHLIIEARQNSLSIYPSPSIVDVKEIEKTNQNQQITPEAEKK
jgi:hypothetical protein